MLKCLSGRKNQRITFRIQEEREIMGFSEDKTYRRFVIVSSSLEFYNGPDFDLYDMDYIIFQAHQLQRNPISLK